MVLGALPWMEDRLRPAAVQARVNCSMGLGLATHWPRSLLLGPALAAPPLMLGLLKFGLVGGFPDERGAAAGVVVVT